MNVSPNTIFGYTPEGTDASPVLPCLACAALVKNDWTAKQLHADFHNRVERDS